jgi:rare lipoprotein A
MAGCSLFEVKDGAPSRPVDVSQIPDAVPRAEPRSPYGNPPSYEQDGVTYYVLSSPHNYKARGLASWYGTKFHGERTSSGEIYDMYSMSAAHKTLPLPTYVKVTNLRNGKQVVVKVNDRGPFKEGRLIDLSYAAAVKLGFHHQGTTEVEVEAIVPEGTHRVTAPIAVPEGKERLYVQIGAFSDREKAQRLVRAIQTKVPWPVSSTPISVRSKTLYRVRVGPIDTLDQANQLVDILTMPELGAPKVVFE